MLQADYAKPPRERKSIMDYRLELVLIPVSDVDRAKAFYAERVGFDVDLEVRADTDHRVSDERRVVQLTPPGSACSLAFGIGILDTQPGSVQALHLVVSDIEDFLELRQREVRRIPLPRTRVNKGEKRATFVG